MKNSIILKFLKQQKEKIIAEKLIKYSETLEYSPVENSKYFTIGRVSYTEDFALDETADFSILIEREILPLKAENKLKIDLEPIYLNEDDLFTTHHKSIKITIISKLSGNSLTLIDVQLVSIKEEAKRAGRHYVKTNSTLTEEESESLMASINSPRKYVQKPYEKSKRIV